MKKGKNENEVYFLGGRTVPGKMKKFKTLTGITIAATVVTLSSAAIFYFTQRNPGAMEEEKELILPGDTFDVVSVLPEGSILPKFNGKKDINEFYSWIVQNLVYPKGYETEEGKVIVSFVVMKNGELGKFDILEAPRNKVFENTVIELLKRSPRWEPAELADGTKVGMRFTLPVTFKSPGK